MDDRLISDAAAGAEQLCAALWTQLQAEARAGRSGEVGALAQRIADVCGALRAVTAGGDPAGPDERGGGSPDLEAGVDGSEELQGGDRATVVDEGEWAGEIEVRDARGEGEAPWVAAVRERVARYFENGERFALLVVEVLDAGGRPGRADAEQRWVREVDRAMAREMRPVDLLLRECWGRYWVLAPEIDTRAASSLAERLGVAAKRCEADGGLLPQVAVGVAVCPDHGLEAEVLVGHADVDLYAARAGAEIGGEGGAGLVES